MKLLVLIFAAATLLPAQESACYPSSEVQAELEGIFGSTPITQTPYDLLRENIRKLEALAERNPRDLFVQRALLLHLHEERGYDRSAGMALPKRYKRLLQENPNEVLDQYLYVEALAGIYPQLAIEPLGRLIKNHPDFPWPYLALACIRIRHLFAVPAEALEHTRRFLALCPETVEGYSLLPDLQIPRDERGRYARQLRTLLELWSWEQRLPRMALLWDLEVRAASPSKRASVVDRIRREVDQIRASNQDQTKEWFEALSAGYRTIGDAEQARWAETELFRQSAQAAKDQVSIEFFMFRQQQGVPSGSSPGALQQYYRALFDASSKWVDRWPMIEEAWVPRLYALTRLDDSDRGEVESVADEALAARKRAVDYAYRPELRYLVAAAYVKHGVRLDDVHELAVAPLNEIINRREWTRRQWESGDMHETTHAVLAWDIWESNKILADLAIRRGDRDEVIERVMKLRSELPREAPGPISSK